jgi:nucleoside-diphosphate-sugar epimerase
MRVLVAGLGDVGGRAAAQLAAAGHDVVGVRRSEVEGPPGVTMIAGDLTDPTLVERLGPAFDAVLVTVSSDGREVDLYERAYVTGPTTLLHALDERGDPVRRVLFTSSSAVYGQRGGEWVDEDSPTDPASPTARVLVDAERAHLNGPFPATVVRLTGIYGPGRTRLVDLVRDGRAVVGTSPSWTNRIHAADAADALVHLLTLDDPPPVVLGTDDEPADRGDVYRWLADQLGVDGPVVDDARASDRGSKRCSNALLRGLGWTPVHPTFREGYAELVADG